MAAAAASTLLVVLCALVTPVYLQSDQCSTANAVTGNSNVTFNVAPDSYSVNTTYTVSVNLPTNFTTVHLQAVNSTTNETLGQWTTGAGTFLCNGADLLYNTSNTNFSAQWTSPGTEASVEIRAYILEAGNLFLLTKTLTKVAATISPPTTNATAPANSTSSASAVPGNNITAQANVTQATNTATVTLPQTTSGTDSATYSSWLLISIIQTAYLFVNGRQAS